MCYNEHMKKTKNKPFRDWKSSVNNLQRKIMSDPKCISWWVDNIDKVYDTTIERPVSEKLPLLESTSTRFEIIFYRDNEVKNSIFNGLSDVEIHNLIEEILNSNDVYQEVYYYNTIEGYETNFKVKLPKYCLEALRIKFIDGGRLYEYADKLGYSRKYLWFLINKAKREIKKYLKEYNNED